ncbi:hypothetical protein J6590_032502 [Homalodisca vitripennis]|nr:hypothetical protein J6590_032502 [Homalodisca vitripennis]
MPLTPGARKPAARHHDKTYQFTLYLMHINTSPRLVGSAPQCYTIDSGCRINEAPSPPPPMFAHNPPSPTPVHYRTAHLPLQEGITSTFKAVLLRSVTSDWKAQLIEAQPAVRSANGRNGISEEKKRREGESSCWRVDGLQVPNTPIKQRRAWLLFGWLNTERSCPCKQPACFIALLVVVRKSPLSRWTEQLTGQNSQFLCQLLLQVTVRKRIQEDVYEVIICAGFQLRGDRSIARGDARVIAGLALFVAAAPAPTLQVVKDEQQLWVHAWRSPLKL